MRCPMCDQEVDALVKSHVIPEAIAIEGLKAGEYMAIASTQSATFPKKSWTGIYDKIVCESCEQSFHRADECLIAFHRGRHSGQGTEWHQGDYAAVVFREVDASCLHRGLLQILYRAHLSSQEMFNRVDLGPHAEIIRNILASKDSTLDSPYSTVLRYIAEPLAEISVSPFRERIGGVNAYRLYLPNITATIKVDQRDFEEPFFSCQLRHGAEVLAINATRLSPSERRVVHKIHGTHSQSIDRMFSKFKR